jgi:hypothetical protein
MKYYKHENASRRQQDIQMRYCGSITAITRTDEIK